MSSTTGVTSSVRCTSTRKFDLPVISELYNPNFLDVLLPSNEDVVMVEYDDGTTAASGPPNAMMDALRGTANRTYTDNGAQAFSSTLSPVLDAFNGLRRDVFASEMYPLLDNAWKEDPQLTLRLIWNLRSIHDGKAERKAFYCAFGWLYKNHPRTAIQDLHMLVKPVCVNKKKGKVIVSAHGYWKDLLNIVALAAVDQLVDAEVPSTFLHAPRSPFTYPRRNRAKIGTVEERIAAHLERNQQLKQVKKQARRVKADTVHQSIATKLSSDTTFRALYIAVARLFSEQLLKDISVLNQLATYDGDVIALKKTISLAGKWAPTPGGAHDRVTLLSTAISDLLYQSGQLAPAPSILHSNDISSNDRAQVLRSFYQRWVLTELRRVSACPEPLMSSNRWKEIIYTRVPSICMKNNVDRFMKHDPEGFEKYLLSVESGKKGISGATLMPHELVAEVMRAGRSGKQVDSIKARVADAQWKTLVNNLCEAGKLDNCLAVCDVSGSMGSLGYYDKRSVQPILPAVALSLIIASVAKPPFNGGFITFSSNPQFVQVDLTKSLGDQVRFMESSNWGMNTDFQAVFLKLLLPLAKANNLKQEDMIKRLFVFTDMQFDAALTDDADWNTNYDVIEKAYKEAGYEVPQMVFWDLAMSGTTRTVEVMSNRKGVAMMNGFSPAMLKVFMGDEVEESEWENVNDDGDTSMTVIEKSVEDFTPQKVMEKALMKESFDGLVVVD
ncbi:hypothetical protein CVT24_008553 [Panaeolus cyanescens]|uniref:TROVE domain-containing protein n=1 Tax=Panaeolus cyanescens TaxID=181874 RepID=A0A409VB67_9AGAR|nr:hypothetical protein CVT24_008553 [Panaeolus cyanescens]